MPHARVPVLLVALVLGLFVGATASWAEPIRTPDDDPAGDGAAVYGIFSNGTFDTNATDGLTGSYTVIRLVEFQGTFPGPMFADLFPANGEPVTITPNSEYFLLGYVDVDPGPGSDDHLLISVKDGDPGAPAPWPDGDGFHDQLRDGLRSFAAENPGAVQEGVAAAAFWEAILGAGQSSEASRFFDLDFGVTGLPGGGPVLSLSGGSLSEEGAVDLFGHSVFLPEIDGVFTGRVTGLLVDGKVQVGWTPVPEPATFGLLGGALGLGLLLRRRGR